MGRVVSLLEPERSELLAMGFYAAGIGVVSLTIPVAVAALVNTIAFGTVLQPVVVLSGLVLVGLLFEGALEMLRLWVLEQVQQRMFARVALDIAQRIPRCAEGSSEGADLGVKAMRFLDVALVQKTLSALCIDGLGVVLQTVIGLLVLAFYHPALLAFDVLLVIGIVVVLVPLGYGAIPTSIAESKAKYATAEWLSELGRNPGAFRHGAGPEFAESQALGRVESYLKYRGAHFRVLFRQHLGARLFKAIVSAALLALGGWLVTRRGLTVGQLVAAELIVTAVVTGMAKFGKQLEAWYDLVASSDKIGHLTDLQPEPEVGLVLPMRGAKGAPLALESVTASDPLGRAKLTAFSLKVAPGAKCALFLDDPWAREMLAQVCMGEQRADSGAVRLDGADLRELAPHVRREAVLSLSKVDLFEGTIHDNLTLGRGDVSDETVRGALSAVGLTNVVASLPHGLLSTLVSGGWPLGASERSALLVARALVQRPRLVVIDGLFDGLRPEVQATLTEAMGRADEASSVLLLTSSRSLWEALPTTWSRVGSSVSSTHEGVSR